MRKRSKEAAGQREGKNGGVEALLMHTSKFWDEKTRWGGTGGGSGCECLANGSGRVKSGKAATGPGDRGVAVEGAATHEPHPPPSPCMAFPAVARKVPAVPSSQGPRGPGANVATATSTWPDGPSSRGVPTPYLMREQDRCCRTKRHECHFTGRMERQNVTGFLGTTSGLQQPDFSHVLPLLLIHLI